MMHNNTKLFCLIVPILLSNFSIANNKALHNALSLVTVKKQYINHALNPYLKVI
jgi:hypothetical protein